MLYRWIIIHTLLMKMSTTKLETLEIETGIDPSWSIIWLHGLGADGHDFESIIPQLDLPESARFIFPHAPIRPVTINGNYPMRAWYDIFSLERGGLEDEDSIRKSSTEILQLIEIEAERGIPSTRLFLVGFSQGAAMALYTGLTKMKSLAGIIALSGYLPVAKKFPSEKTDANKLTPIFMAHGSMDPTVPESYGKSSKEILKSEGYQVDWHTYSMGHSICQEEVVDIKEWLEKQFRSQD